MSLPSIPLSSQTMLDHILLLPAVPPQITIHVHPQDATVGSEVNVTCWAGLGFPSVSEINLHHPYGGTTLLNGVPHTIRSVGVVDGGEYTCSLSVGPIQESCSTNLIVYCESVTCMFVICVLSCPFSPSLSLPPSHLRRRNDSNISDAIMQSANNSLKSYKYIFNSGRIITGKEEATGGWITANYASKRLRKVRIFLHCYSDFLYL